METVTNTYHIPLGKVAKKLEVTKRALNDFLRKKDLFFQLPRDGRGIIIPIPLANRILGKKSNPPQKIDEFEYDYPPSFVAKRIGVSSDTFRQWLYMSDWRDICLGRCDYRGIRVPRSVALILLDAPVRNLDCT